MSRMQEKDGVGFEGQAAVRQGGAVANSITTAGVILGVTAEHAD